LARLNEATTPTSPCSRPQTATGRRELFEYIHAAAIDTKPTQPNEIGVHRVAFSADDINEALQIAARIGCDPLRGVATFEDAYKLAYIRGPSGIIVQLAEKLKKSTVTCRASHSPSRQWLHPCRTSRTPLTSPVA
jgi:catechol 2,3-dioxygenase-like lactoylglutathione lyase family enzyme